MKKTIMNLYRKFFPKKIDLCQLSLAEVTEYNRKKYAKMHKQLVENYRQIEGREAEWN